MGPTCILGFGTVFTAIALLLVALSFSTDNWIVYTVDRAGLKANGASSTQLASNPLYFTRNRGLFRTCYPGNETIFLESVEYKDKVVDKSCLKEDGLSFTQEPSKINYGSFYDMRNHLIKSHVAFFVIALLLLIVGCIGGSVGCWKMSPRALRISGLVVFMGAFAVSGGMAFFHGYEYLEKQKIAQSEFPKVWADQSPLGDYAAISYGYSYIVGWVGTGCAFISAILYLCAANTASQIQKKERKQQAMSDKQSKRSLEKGKSVYEYNPEPVVYPGYQSNYEYSTYDPYTTKAYPVDYPAVDYSGGYRY